MDKTIIDICCGSKMFWFQKQHPSAVYMDIREFDGELCDGRKLIVKPDVIGDFKNIPYPDNSFKVAVFDPPHLINAGNNSWLVKKYGKLPEDFSNELIQGFNECMRVLEPYGLLVFKWCAEQIPTSQILKLFDRTPLFGDKRAKTSWIVFMKE